MLDGARLFPDVVGRVSAADRDGVATGSERDGDAEPPVDDVDRKVVDGQVERQVVLCRPVDDDLWLVNHHVFVRLLDFDDGCEHVAKDGARHLAAISGGVEGGDRDGVEALLQEHEG